MKKLLLAALLIIGATSFGAEVIEMSQKAGTTETVLPIAVRGKVVAPTGMQVVITPTVASSADGRSLDLNFGDILKGTINEVPMKAGEFEIKLLNAGEAVAFAQPPVVTLQGGTEVDATNHTYDVVDTQNQKILSLDYVYNGAMSGDKLYKGRVEVTPDVTGNEATGLFTATAVNLGISITNQDASGNTSFGG